MTPGPGHYEDKKELRYDIIQKTQGKNGTFGTTEQRFAPQPGQQIQTGNVVTPGPGHYIQPNSD